MSVCFSKLSLSGSLFTMLLLCILVLVVPQAESIAFTVFINFFFGVSVVITGWSIYDDIKKSRTGVSSKQIEYRRNAAVRNPAHTRSSAVL